MYMQSGNETTTHRGRTSAEWRCDGQRALNKVAQPDDEDSQTHFRRMCKSTYRRVRQRTLATAQLQAVDIDQEMIRLEACIPAGKHNTSMFLAGQ
jgi:CRISPR/Cas system Type II protein with McrA/HNH and RuvC-like nuclease domain